MKPIMRIFAALDSAHAKILWMYLGIIPLLILGFAWSILMKTVKPKMIASVLENASISKQKSGCKELSPQE